MVLELSHPPGDAPCPFCGSLVWFSHELCAEPRKTEAAVALVSNTGVPEPVPGQEVSAAEVAEVDAIYALLDKVRQT